MSTATPPGPTKSSTQVEIGFPVSWAVSNPRTGLVVGVNGVVALVEYEKMAEQDETVGAMMWLIESTIGQVEWLHTPQIYGAEAKNDPTAMEWAAKADTILGDMEDTWLDHIAEAASMIYFGHAPFEITLKQRNGTNSKYADNFYGISSLSFRDPTSIMQWLYSDYPADRQLVGFQQSTIAGGCTIPMWKICNYRIRGSAAKPMGRSLLRNAYRVWKLKNRIQDSEAIGIDRDLVGLPIFRMPQAVIDQASETVVGSNPPVFTPAAIAAQAKIQAAIKSVRDLRFNEAGGLVLPSDTYSDEVTGDKTPMYDFKIMTSAGQRSIDTRNPIRDYDRAIARLLLMQFLQLGTTSGGSNGLSDDQSSLAISSLAYLADKIASTYTESALRLVWTINAWPMQYFPKLDHAPINKNGIAAVGQYMRGLGGLQWLLEEDPNARVQALELAGIKTNETAQAYTPPPPPPAPTFLGNGPQGDLFGHNGGPPLEETKPAPAAPAPSKEPAE
jgi:hypothetical protein